MKKFITRIPLQLNGNLKGTHYQAVGNEKLQMSDTTAFPIITAIQGYVGPGEMFEVYALGCDTEPENENFRLLCEEVRSICEKKNIVCSGVKRIMLELDQSVIAQTRNFQELIRYVEDDDELYACMTFGTKPQSIVMIMGIKYAYRIKKNVSIGCILYGEKDHKTGEGKVYDMTALIQLDEVVRVLAEQRVENPQNIIQMILDL